MHSQPLLTYELSELPDGVRLDLPRRDLGRWRWVAAIPMGLGLVVLLFMIGWMAVPITQAVRTTGLTRWVLIGFGLLGLLGITTGLGVMGIGLAILRGRGSVELLRGQVRHTEHVGPFHKSWSRPTDRLLHLTVGNTIRAHLDIDDDNTPATDLPGDLSALSAAFDDGSRPMLLAIGYPRQLLLQAAMDLAQQARRFGIGQLAVVDGHAADGVPGDMSDVTIDADSPPSMTGAERILPPLDQPRGSRCVVETRADGLTIIVPPAGVWKGNKGLFFFALIWLGFMTVFTPLWFVGKGGPSGVAMLGIGAFLTLFWAIGVAMLVAALNMGRRRAVLDVVGKPGHTLLVTQQSLFGIKQHDWPAQRIRAIRAGPSDMEVNDREVLQLRIELDSGKTHGLLAGRDEAELRWLANALGRALGEGSDARSGSSHR